MRHIPGSGISMLCSFLVGAWFTGLGVMHFQSGHEPPPPGVITPSLTPTYEMTPPDVEGDDGSLGGPVYDQNHQQTPTYIYKTS
jgi:hypothetical protein